MIDRHAVVEAAKGLMLGNDEIEIAEVNRLLAEIIPGWPGDDSSYRQLGRWLKAPRPEAMSEIRALLLGIMAIDYVRTDPDSQKVGDWWLAAKKLRQLLRVARQQALLHGNKGQA